MKRKTIQLLFLLLMMYTTGCNDADFLREVPETSYTIENIFSTPGQIDQAIITSYSHLRELVTNPANERWIHVLRYNGTDMYDVANIRKGETFNDYGLINPNHGNFNNAYSIFYQMAARMNLAIVSAELPELRWANEAQKKYTIAQAKFFRAFAYKNLGELFGGVPLVDEVISSARFDFKRSTRIETYQFAIDDLESIYMDLPETTTSGGRLVRGAAQHYLAELYLAKGIQYEAEGNTVEARRDYQQSVDYAGMLIDGTIYSLMTTRFGTRKSANPIYYYDTAEKLSYETVIGVTQGNVYWDLFQEGNVNYQDGNKECVWALQIDFDAYKATDSKSKLPYAGNFGPVFRDGVKDHLAGLLADVGGRGVCYVMPTMYTRDTIYAGKWADDMRNSEAVYRRVFLGNKAGTPTYGKVIPWSDIYTSDNSRSLCFPVSCKVSTDKFKGVEVGENRTNLFRDEYMIRLSETILLRAEAKMRLGDLEGAADDINKLRSRAACGYRVTAADIHVDLILDERARELVYEEWRWNTLLRMGGNIATERIKKYAYWPEAKATLTFNFNLWPIPQTVIDTNKDVKLEQNPGWENR